jgi:hypothetical protein
MTLPILGAAEGFTEEEASKPAIALGMYMLNVLVRYIYTGLFSYILIFMHAYIYI